MTKSLKILALLLSLCMLFAGCTANSSSNEVGNASETEADSDQLVIISYQYENFVQLVTNEQYDIANTYWEDNVEFHTDKDSLNYYYYNCGMISYNNGVYAHAIEYFEKVEPEILDVTEKLTEVINEIGKFNGVYKSSTMDGTNICINNGYVDLIFDDDDYTEPRYYTRVLKKDISNNGTISYSITNNIDETDNYTIDNISNDYTSLEIIPIDNNEQQIFSGTFVKTTNEAPPISNNN